MSSTAAQRRASDWVDPDGCRHLFRTLVAGVGVVTATDRSGPVGMTASSILAVSVDPPLLLVSLANESRTLSAIRRVERFAVNLLRAEQRQLAERFAEGRPFWVRFAEVGLRELDPPVFDAALSAAVCDLLWMRGTGDHTLVLGRIERAVLGPGSPLVWHGSGYHQLLSSQRLPDSA